MCSVIPSLLCRMFVIKYKHDWSITSATIFVLKWVFFLPLYLCVHFFPCIIISLCLYYVLHAFPLVISCMMIMCLYCIIPCLSKQEFSFYLSIKMAWTCCEILKNNDLKNLIMFGIVCNTNVSKIICIKKGLKNPCDFRTLSWV